jgi:hypothetical protein
VRRNIGAHLCLALVLLACRQARPRTSGEPHLEVSWGGKDSGTVSGGATARWCELRRVFEFQAVRGDTGAAVAVYPGPSLAPGTYQVVDPAKAESLPRTAALALRWLGKNAVQGFQGESGRVVLQRSSSGLYSGRLAARARSVSDTQRISVSGSFHDLAVRRDTLGCSPPEDDTESDADTADTGVH